MKGEYKMIDIPYFFLQKRLQKELQALTKDPPKGVRVSPDGTCRTLSE